MLQKEPTVFNTNVSTAFSEQTQSAFYARIVNGTFNPQPLAIHTPPECLLHKADAIQKRKIIIPHPRTPPNFQNQLENSNRKSSNPLHTLARQFSDKIPV